MAALQTDRNTQMRDGELISAPVKSGVKIYAGAIVVAEDGYAAPGKKVYIVDDQTVTKTAAGASDTGAAVVVGIESDGVWIG